MKAKRKHKKRKGNRLFAAFFEASGIPKAYSTTVSWFAERIILACVCIIALSFSIGVLFTLRLSQPIADSQLYATVSSKVEGLSQQVIDITSPVFLSLLKGNRNESELKAKELAARIEMLRQYFLSKNSPFAEDESALEAFAVSKNMKLMIAISFVESTFGQRCYYYNCSGIGGTPPNLRKYESYAYWIRDFDNLLEARYKGLPPEKFIGLYVQPGSPNWLFGDKQVLREFDELEIDA